MPTADGMGRTVATEVLVPTPAIRNLIREGKTHQIYAAVQTSGAVGMQTMDADLVLNGIDFVRIEFKEAFGVSFDGVRAAVLVHQVGGLALGFEDVRGCMSVPFAVAPESPTA